MAPAPRVKQVRWPGHVALGLVGVLGLGACASYRLKRDLRRKDLPAVQAASAKDRARLSPKWRRRYAQLLADRGQVLAAQRWWLGSYLRGADLEALEALAVSHARGGSVGFAAAQFAQVLATERGALKHRDLACKAWTQRKAARIEVGAFVSAQRDERRLQAICGLSSTDSRLASKAGAQRMARSEAPSLVRSFSPALMPAFLDPAWRHERMGGAYVQKASLGRGEDAVKERGPVAEALFEMLESKAGVPDLGPWLSGDASVRRPGAARELLHAMGQDPTLGARAAALCALLGASGHSQALALVQENLRASSSLQSAPSARLRVILALVQGRREGAIFWMRLGASQVQDLGAWWLWCARWAQLTGQAAATKVAYQALVKVVAPQSPARWTVSWWRLKQKILEVPVDPYLQTDAPSRTAHASVRAFWDQFLASLPAQAVPGVWPALVDELVQSGWTDAQIEGVGRLLFGDQGPPGWAREILVSRAQQRMVEQDPRQALHLTSASWRGQAWRKLWSTAGVNAGALARYRELFDRDPVWSPRVDPLAALSVLFSRPKAWGVQD